MQAAASDDSEHGTKPTQSERRFDGQEEAQISVLLDMGFEQDVAVRALRVAGGDVEAAVGSLLYRASALS